MKKVILQKLNSTSRPIVGKVPVNPIRGRKLVVELMDGVSEYVTTPVVRIFQVVNDGTIYVETINNKYRIMTG